MKPDVFKQLLEELDGNSVQTLAEKKTLDTLKMETACITSDPELILWAVLQLKRVGVI